MAREVKIKIPTPDDVLPDEFKKHMLQAYKESLLALKSLIEEHIKKIEELSAEKKEIKKIEIE
jgi:hypothetical protein